MSHDAMKSDGELTSFPLRETHIIDEDYKIVSRDPQHQINILNPLRLYGGACQMDIFTQWTNKSSDVFILPASSYEYMKKLLREPYSKHCEIDCLLKNMLAGDHTRLLKDATAIIVPVFGENHYSFSCILNPSLVVDGSYKHDKTRYPCILVGNSLLNYGKSHRPSNVVKILKLFLNKFMKYHYTSATGNFNLGSIPTIELEVPEQSQPWDCLYQVMLMVHSTKKLLKNYNNRLDFNIVGDTYKIESEYFSYDPADITKIRESLRYLIMCLKLIRRFHNDSSIALDFSEASILSNEIVYDDVDDADTWKAVHPYKPPKHTAAIKQEKREVPSKLSAKKKKSTHRLLNEGRKDLLKKKKQEVDRREFHGQGLTSDHPSKKEENIRVQRRKDRLIGQCATSLRCSKDKSYRRATHKFTKSFHNFRQMSRYSRSDTNKKELRIQSFSVVHDPICERPDVEGDEYVSQQRDSPCRLIIVDDEETADFLMEDLLTNFHKYKIVSRPKQVDKAVFGTNRPSIEEAYGRKTMRKSRDHESSIKLLEEKVNEIAQTPSNDNTKKESCSLEMST